MCGGIVGVLLLGFALGSLDDAFKGENSLEVITIMFFIVFIASWISVAIMLGAYNKKSKEKDVNE